MTRRPSATRPAGFAKAFFVISDAGRLLTLDEIAALNEAFGDSDLPYKVDIVDWHGIDERFRQSILGQRQELSGTFGTR